jgi:hypothetical protein
MELLALLFVVPVGLYLLLGGGRGRVWGLVFAGEGTRGVGAYRESPVRTWKRGAAPLSVRIASLSSFFLGQMILPGALAALIGLIAAAEVLAKGRVNGGGALIVVLEASAPTGLVVAAHLLGAGSAMIARSDDAAAKARAAARWAIGHNVALLIAMAAIAIAMPRDAAMVLPSVAYACVSIGQALLLRRAAASLDAYDTEQAAEPAPADAEMAGLVTAR